MAADGSSRKGSGLPRRDRSRPGEVGVGPGPLLPLVGGLVSSTQVGPTAATSLGGRGWVQRRPLPYATEGGE